MKHHRIPFQLVATIIISTGIACIFPAFAQEEGGIPPPSLKTIQVPKPANLGDYIRDEKAAIRLGKALFWDMQLGSDGVQSCATCHFHAGADSRTKNQLNPGLLAGDASFRIGGVNQTLYADDFPFHRRRQPVDFQSSSVLWDTNDVFSSQGVRNTEFLGIIPGNAVELGSVLTDPVFNILGVNTRRVEPRNSPTVINAVFNYTNFWDGRANFYFNGENPFGPADPNAGIFINNNGTLEKTPVLMEFSSLASQAVGPPLSDFEMSFQGRTYAHIGRKMLSLRPLDKQIVHPHDSVLGYLSRSKIDKRKGSPIPTTGLKSSYKDMIMAAFKPEYWNSIQAITFTVTPESRHLPDSHDPRDFMLNNGIPSISGEFGIMSALADDQFNQMEANFAFFLGLAIQLYESTLVSDDTPFDRYAEGDTSALTSQQIEGMNLFFGPGRCANCHGGPEFTNASVSRVQQDGLIERMAMAVGEAFYDTGFYNIAVRPTGEDLGRGGSALGFPLSFSRLAFAKRAGELPDWFERFVADLPCSDPCDLNRVAVDGAFKTPSLRNIELTGPYFHNGGASTLRQVVDFYVRGGDFPADNIDNLAPDINTIAVMQGNDQAKDALVAFMLALTDDRVRDERAPFDHPQLFVPDGQCDPNPALDDMIEIPAVGAQGRRAARLPVLGTFLGLSPFQQ